MGVKDLWSVISPVCDKMSLWELRDKKIAIDLSAWVCDSQNVACNQRNMYLRNLFFRTSYLLLSGVHPVFVLEGTAPELKRNTIRKRMNRDNKEDIKTKAIRSRLNSLQKQCSELLSYMGVSCVQAPGEAEAYCAHLNQLGLVYGVVTQDSDAFLYGAVRVFRNFQLGPSYTCDVYTISSISDRLGLTRTKLVAFSLITGCDYTSGVNKAGKESALKFIKTLPDEEIFQKFQSWRKESLFPNLEKNKYSICSAIEITIRNKALQDKEFPNMEVVEEYLKAPENIEFDYTWALPNIPKFVSLAARKLSWEEDYADEKFLPLVTRWHLINNGAQCGLVMKKVVKKRILKGIHGYDVTWNVHEDFITTEDQHLVQSVYPDLVEAFESLKRKPLKDKTVSKRKRKQLEERPLTKVLTLEQFLQPLQEDDVQDDSFGYDENDLDLSAIVQTVISRTDANPALAMLKSLKC